MTAPAPQPRGPRDENLSGATVERSGAAVERSDAADERSGAADEASDGAAGAAPKRVVMAYIPEGYTLRKAQPRSRPAARTPAPPRRDASTWVIALTLTLVVGLIVGYLAGFAVARRTVESRVDVTVHQSTSP